MRVPPSLPQSPARLFRGEPLHGDPLPPAGMPPLQPQPNAVTPSHQLHVHGAIVPAKAGLTGMVDTVRDLRPYLVQVLDALGEQVQGTGFLCDEGGHVLTCWHVVQEWPERDMKGEVRWKGQLVDAELILERSVPEADLAVLKLEASGDIAAEGCCPHLPMDVHERLQLKDELRSCGYPVGQFSEGISIRGKIGGFETTQVKGLDVLPIAGLNLDNIDSGYSGAPVFNERTQKVIGLVHAKQHSSQAFIVPLAPLFRAWPELRVAHDVFEHVRLELGGQARNGLEGKLHAADFIPLRLEAGRIEKDAQGGRGTAEAQDPTDRRKWENFDLSGLQPLQGRFMLSADVGSGKTTFVQWLAAELVQRTGDVPVVMDCKTLERLLEQRNLEDLLAEAIRPLEGKFLPEDLKDWRRQAIDSSRLVFLFDGLDQIPSGRGYDLAKRAFSLIGQNPVLITSRPSALIALERELDPTLIFLRLQPFSDHDQRVYFGYHYAVVREACAQAPDLTRVPMLAYMMRELAADGMRPGQATRTELYGRFVNHVLTKHDSNAPLLDEPGILNVVQWELGKLAYEALAKPKPHIQRVPIRLHNNQANSSAPVSKLIAFGLVNRILDSDREALYFTHQSFQEFLAAFYAHKRSTDDDSQEEMVTILRERWHPKWAEVISFLAGLQGSRMIQLLILADGDNLIHSSLFIGARCVAEVKEIEPVIIEDIKTRLLTLADNSLFCIDALEALSELGRWTDPQTVHAIIARLGDQEETVCKSAEKAVRALADRLDHSAVQAIVSRLGDEDFVVRRSALNALSGCLDEDVVQAIVARLGDREGLVRESAVKALTAVAERLDEAALQAILAWLSDENRDVRIGALKLLKVQAGIRYEAAIQPLDEVTVQALIAVLNDESWSVLHETVLSVLGALADRLDDAVVQSIIVRLGDEDMAVRKGALRALTGLVDRLDEEAVQAIVARLGDREVTVRENAL